MEQPNRGLIGGAWQKQPMLLGFSAGVHQQAQADSTGDPTTSLSLSAVPAGEVWVVNFVSYFHTNVANINGVIYASDNGTDYEFAYIASHPIYQVGVDKTMFVMEEDDYLKMTWWVLADTKTMFLRMWGYKFDIDL